MIHLVIIDNPVKDGLIVTTAEESTHVDSGYSGRVAAAAVFKMFKEQMNESFMYRMSRFFLEFAAEENESIREALSQHPKAREYLKAPVKV
jgi:hypothetical protein